MQTTQTRSAPPVPVRNLNGSALIRRGFLACRASSGNIASIPGIASDATLRRHALALVQAVEKGLHEAAQLAISHPTPATLGDAFNAADAVQAVCRKVGRRASATGKARIHARLQVFLAGVKAGLAELEAGLECIPLLPCTAPDYPEVEE